MMTVILQNDTVAEHVPKKTQFQQWIDVTCAIISDQIPKTCHEIGITIIDKLESEQLNTTYRHQKNPTNVLSFTYDNLPGIPAETLGDLAMCADIVAEEAVEQQKTLQAHWAHLTIHGLLHLAGYDHETDNDAHVMEQLEISILEKLGFDNPYEAIS